MIKYDTIEKRALRSKKRLTITLSPDLVGQVDRLIDRKTVRSRSHAIEVLIRRSLKPTVTTAVVLAGGGKNGLELPALAPIGRQPLISLTIHHLMKFGIRTFIVLAGQQEERIKALLGGGESLGATVRYVAEKRPRGTAGAVKIAEAHLDEGPFLVIHGDVLTDINLRDFIDFHLSEGSLATIAVKPRQAERRYGQVLLQGNRITDFLEMGRSEGISIVNTGVYLFERPVLGLIDEERPTRLERDVFPRLARMGELSAFLFQGIWFDIGTPDSYRSARRRWKQKGGDGHAEVGQH